MATTTPTENDIPTFATELAEAVVRMATDDAERVAHFLDNTGFFPLREIRKEPVSLPAEFLLELAAILRLALWEEGGLRGSLPADLPPARQALALLIDRAMTAPTRFRTGADAAPLMRRVRDIWLSRMAWTGTDHLGADLLVTGTDNDDFAEIIADFLWKHRHLAQNEAHHEEA